MLPDDVERRDATRVAMHNQEVQALTLIALELRELRILLGYWIGQQPIKGE
jgi:precorrin-6B methylase 2